MISIEIAKILLNRKIPTTKLPSTQVFYHGLIGGLDLGELWNTSLALLASENDSSSYHTLIMETDPEKIALMPKLIDVITGKDRTAEVTRLSSSDPKEIEAWINEWLDDDFKF